MTLSDFLTAIATHDAQATKGPWQHRPDRILANSWCIAEQVDADDADFIAFARTALPLAGRVIEDLLETVYVCASEPCCAEVQKTNLDEMTTRLQNIIDAATPEDSCK